jgi:membrane protein required for colicin V production
MNLLDIILILPLAYGIIKGVIKGFVLQLASLIGLIAGIYFAKLYASSVATLFYHWFDISLQYGKAIAFLVLFLIVGLLVYLLAKSLDRFIELISLKWLNKLLGALFGGLKYALILSVLLNVFQAIDKHSTIILKNTKKSSLLYNPITSIVPSLIPYVNIDDFKGSE